MLRKVLAQAGAGLQHFGDVSAVAQHRQIWGAPGSLDRKLFGGAGLQDRTTASRPKGVVRDSSFPSFAQLKAARGSAPRQHTTFWTSH